MRDTIDHTDTTCIAFTKYSFKNGVINFLSKVVIFILKGFAPAANKSYVNVIYTRTEYIHSFSTAILSGVRLLISSASTSPLYLRNSLKTKYFFLFTKK